MRKRKEESTAQPMVCMCGKCGEEKEIAVLVDGVPWCSDCFLANFHAVDGETGEVLF